jgi:putative acetyltransferase
MRVRLDDLRGREVAELLSEHLESLAKVTPAESRHALDLEGLRRPDVTFWSVWDGESLVGCGALKDLGGGHGEIKSMRTSHKHLRRGVATTVLRHIIGEAGRRGYTRLSLETGSMDYFEPARRLYSKFGFKPCEPFGEYVPDRNSVFMTRVVKAPSEPYP